MSFTSKELKYIVVRGDYGTEGLVVFDTVLSHRQVAYNPERVISAGFIWVQVHSDGTVSVDCYGRSSTLMMDSRPEADSALARIMFRNTY